MILSRHRGRFTFVHFSGKNEGALFFSNTRMCKRKSQTKPITHNNLLGRTIVELLQQQSNLQEPSLFPPNKKCNIETMCILLTVHTETS